MVTYGWDLSHYDSPDSRHAVVEGFQFFTHKAGGDSPDAEIGRWWDLMKPLRGQALLGAYWVLYPRDAARRADSFIARLDATCDGWRDGPFILQVDCEIWGGDLGSKPGRSDIRAFCDRLTDRMPKLRPIVYAPKWAYGDSLTGLGYPLWASSYVTGTGSASSLYPGDTSARWNSYSGQVPAVLQFSSSATIAGQSTCDANAYRGTIEELTALVSPGWKDQIMATVDLTPAALRAVEAACADALAGFLFGAFHAAGNGNTGDAVYAAADTDTKRSWRNARDTLQGVVGGPVDPGTILAAIATLDAVDEAALAAALIPGLGAVISTALQNSIPDGTLTAEEVQQITENALRNVLRTGTDVPSLLEHADSAALPVWDTLTREQREARQAGIAGTGGTPAE